MDKILNRLERKFGKYAIRNLTLYLIIGQVVGFLLFHLSPSHTDILFLQGKYILQGQFWRFFTMLIVPFSTDPIFFALEIYFYYLIGNALENQWGSFRYFVYFLIAYLLTILAAFLFPLVTFDNFDIYISIFLAFAYLYPNFELLIFFIIPVKIKWFALLIWIGVLGSLVFGDLSIKILAIISILNFLLFFGKDLISNWYLRLRGMKYKAKTISESGTSYMKCAVCGKTEKDKKIFYNCDECIPDTCYCEDHINDHKHMF
jgi:hypothetical protein